MKLRKHEPLVNQVAGTRGKMRKAYIFLLLGLAGAYLLTSPQVGFVGTDVYADIQSVASESVSDCDWTDVWVTVGAGSGNLTLEQDSKKVTGSWLEPKKGGTLEGNIEARYLTGDWRNPGTKTSGQFRFQISEDCKRFHGEWNITKSGDPGIKPDEGAKDGKFTRTWNGTRKTE